MRTLSAFKLCLTFGVLTFISPVAKAQYYREITTKAFDHLDKKEYDQALKLGQEIYSVFPDNISGHVICAFSLINLGKASDAGTYITAGLKTDPSYFPIIIDAGYYFAATGDVDRAKAHLTESMKLFPKDVQLPALLEEIRIVGQNVGKSSQFNELAAWYDRTKPTIKEHYISMQELNGYFFEHAADGAASLRAKTEAAAEDYRKGKWHDMVIGTYCTASWWFRTNNLKSDAIELAEAAYSYYRKNGCGENFDMAGYMYQTVIDSYTAVGNDERAVQFSQEIVDISPKMVVHASDAKCLQILAGAYDRLQKNDDARAYAAAAYKVAETNGYKQGMVAGANALCAAYNIYRFPEDGPKCIQYGEAGLRLASQLKLEEMMGPLIGNLAVGYLKVGTKEAKAKSLQLHGSLVKIYKERKQWAAAALTLNNAGALYTYIDEYASAARLFEESIALGEMAVSNLSNDDKLTFYQSQISAYEFAAMCYAKLNNVEKTFDMLEGSRSRVLSERLTNGERISKSSVAEVQSKLESDQAQIMYSLFSGHEVIILVITKKFASVLFHSDIEFVGKIKDKYLDRINKEHGDRKGLGRDEVYDRDRAVQEADFKKVTQLTRKFFENPGMADNILDEYLKGYYRFLILPVQNRLSNIKKLILSPDDVLNFIPYEALKSGDGKYLVEKFDVKYTHGAAISKLLESRQYSSSRKPLLAMGGAVFNVMNVEAPVIQNQQDLNFLQLHSQELMKQGESQREAYAALFGKGPMNYLPGTVEEVNNVGNVVPGALVFTVENMTENRIKELSKNGELAKYKVLHLATHGFVVDELPALSGVAMSIFPDERGGEDGFLNTNEISSLKLNADLTVLSACQTALGKIYSGEGVTGLTQSLIVAGSNAALVSLWPVNDTSTMLFMSGLYKESLKGKPYAQVVNELKRKFIKGEFGEQFRHPNFWAPFVYIGQ